MIRALNEKDVDAFIRLRKESIVTMPASFGADPDVEIDRETTEKDLKGKSEENFILGYFEGQTLVAMLGFIRYKNQKTRHKAFIWGVYVSEDYRGKKIGKQLMMACIERAKSISGLEKILLGVSHISDAAIGLYESMGFTTYGAERNAMLWQGEYIHEILMEKTLS